MARRIYGHTDLAVRLGVLFELFHYKMKNQEQTKKFNEEKFKRTFGVNRQTFQVMFLALEEQYKITHRKAGFTALNGL